MATLRGLKSASRLLIDFIFLSLIVLIMIALLKPLKDIGAD
jgi:hypothetical protein